QFFVRGFNLDHGTDFSLSVAGIPVNMPTHGHGQGYADLNFVIPEMVDRVRYRKGPYYADVGDFSAAGSANMQLRTSLDESLLQVTGGSYDYGRVLWAQGGQLGNGEVVAAIDVFNEDGPWTRGQDYQGYKGLLRYSVGDAMRGHSVTLMGYDADWLSTDQVPRRAIESGQIGLFDLIDEGPRGSTERFSISADIHRGTANTYSELSGYVMAYDFGLISNFTYFLDDPELGDQFEQLDDRVVFGVDYRHSRAAQWGDRRLEIGYGASVRFDDIENGLFRTTDLVRTATVRSDQIEQLQGGIWSDVLVHWGGGWRTRLGLRADAVEADVTSFLPVNSGSEDDFLLSPKFSAVWEATPNTELTLNLGYGFHSNDARGTVISIDPTNGEA
ncbi:MAG: TonB-dependent receptor, partial [Acidobacteriota bacterium]